MSYFVDDGFQHYCLKNEDCLATDLHLEVEQSYHSMIAVLLREVELREEVEVVTAWAVVVKTNSEELFRTLSFQVLVRNHKKCADGAMDAVVLRLCKQFHLLTSELEQMQNSRHCSDGLSVRVDKVE